jgi:hypothetical protein
MLCMRIVALIESIPEVVLYHLHDEAPYSPLAKTWTSSSRPRRRFSWGQLYDQMVRALEEVLKPPVLIELGID